MSRPVSNELMPFIRGEARPARRDQNLVRRGRQVYEDVHETVLRERGGFAIAGDIMEGVADLNQHRRRLAGDDPGLNMELLDIELEAIHGARHELRSYYDRRGF